MVKNPDPGSGMKVSDHISQSVVIIFFSSYFPIQYYTVPLDRLSLTWIEGEGMGVDFSSFIWWGGGGWDTGISGHRKEVSCMVKQ
jgi:hypothetical protein